MTLSRLNQLGLLALIAAVAALPLLRSAFAETVMALAGLYVIVAIGLNLLVGYAGKISFGHHAFMAMGAYASGLLTVNFGWSPLVALITGAVGTGLLAFVIGAAILRLRGHYLAMITLALGQVTITLSTRWTEVTGGLTGVPGVPDFSVLGFSFDTKTKMYYLIWTIAVTTILFSFRVIESRFGRALRALGSHEPAAEALGVPVVRCRIQVFVLSAVLAAIAGSLYAHFLNYVNGTFFELPVMIQLMAMLVVGGIGTMWGPVVGAVALMWASQSLGRYADYSLLIFGLLYGGMLLFVPLGVCGEFARRFTQRFRQAEVQ
jgi:ABC-type branched-subunit amino acid transport system permease subunit